MSTTPVKIWYRGVLPILGVSSLAALLFLPAGRLDWLRGWLFLSLFFVASGLAIFLLVRRDPELVRRRMHVGEGTRWWDRVMVPLLKLAFLAVILVGALDGGPEGGASLSFAWWPPGALLFLGGYGIFLGAMLANTHFESTVRIQSDRGHRVIDQGPYRFVRHPGYAGLLLMNGGVPLLLGSTWALLPLIPGIAILAIRTALEDRLLRRELSGYAEYAQRVRYRIVPWIW